MRLKIQMPTSAKAQLATELEQQQATIEMRDFVGSQAGTTGLHAHPALVDWMSMQGTRDCMSRCSTSRSTVTQQPPLRPITCQIKCRSAAL